MSKIAYLTIDDGPTMYAGEKIDYLIQKGIPAILFCIGRNIEKNEQAIIHAIQNNFIIGSHSYSHKRFSTFTFKECCDEILKTDRIIESVYEKAGVKRPVKVFRFPYGDKGKEKDRLQEFLKELDYKKLDTAEVTYKYFNEKGFNRDIDCFWTFDVSEWAIYRDNHPFGLDSLEKVFERMEDENPLGEDGSLNNPDTEKIILIHDHEESTHLFPRIVDRLLEKGIVFGKPKFEN